MRFIDAMIFGFVVGGLSILLLGTSCINEKRDKWQDCAGVYHEECFHRPDLQLCEYEYYKECINQDTAAPDAR